MSSEKSVAVIPQPTRRVCPICNESVYSAGGIHPQCAIQQADEPRIARLRAARTAEAKMERPAKATWQKTCPLCGAKTHARTKACACGHQFLRSK
jgi:hypothetical protein